MGVNIAIDGTAGGGKGTFAKKISKVLGFYNLDTGALYRSVAYKCRKEGVDPKNEKGVCRVIKNIDFQIVFEKDGEGNQIQNNILEGENLGDKIRSEKVSFDSSLVSQYACVREYATKIQHNVAKRYDVVMEGRDIGTVILPNADVKFFITASPEKRAQRRLEQLLLPQSEYKNVLSDIKDRDKRDMERELSPLKIAHDAHYIDNSDMTIEQTTEKILNIIKGKIVLKR